jgi:tRNA dimethylallyltransferase
VTESPAAIALFGPTAVGKTDVAIALADLLRARGARPVAVSADAYQLYQGLDVLVAKPDAEQLAQLEHRLVSVEPLTSEFSVAQFAERAHAEIDSLLEVGCTPIVVGGTGLYLRAALADLDLRPPPSAGLREQLERELAELGPEAMHGRLPAEVAAGVHPNDRKRIVRALELERMGSRAYDDSEQLWSTQLRHETALFGLLMERELLDARIAERVPRMLSGGAMEEVERALLEGVSRTARKAIGFAEIEALLGGEAEPAQVAERIERRHRQYARRQLTWMRKLAGVELLDRSGLDARQTAQAIVERLDRVPGPWGSASRSGRHSATTT